MPRRCPSLYGHQHAEIETRPARFHVASIAHSRSAPELFRKPSRLPHPTSRTALGTWEAQGAHSTYGLNIQLFTKVLGFPVTLMGVPQYLSGAQFGVYESDRLPVNMGEGHWFTDDSYRVQLTSRTLKVHGSKIAGNSAIILDLTFDPHRDQWSGKVRIDGFVGQLTFARPRPKDRIPRSPLVGTWKHFYPSSICLHVAQQSDGSLAGWSDQLQVPGATRYANGIKPSLETIEIYGVFALIEPASPDAMLITRGVLIPFGGRQTEIGKLTSDPSVMSAGQAAEPWYRVQGDSCASQRDPAAQSLNGKAQRTHNSAASR